MNTYAEGFLAIPGHRDVLYPERDNAVVIPCDMITDIGVGPKFYHPEDLTPVLLDTKYALDLDLDYRVIWIRSDHEILRHLGS